jgi:hypothetical protein
MQLQDVLSKVPVGMDLKVVEAILKNMGGHATAKISHRRPYDQDEKSGLFLYKKVDDDEVVEEVDSLLVRYKNLGIEEAINQIQNVGRIFLHKQGYGTSGLGTNGLNFIALSNDTVTEAATATVLTNEITTNGLARAQGAVTLPTGSGNQTTVDKTFTATGTQSAQKACLLDLSSAGNINHILGFTQRALISGDTLQVTFTITLG